MVAARIFQAPLSAANDAARYLVHSSVGAAIKGAAKHTGIWLSTTDAVHKQARAGITRPVTHLLFTLSLR